MSIKYRKCLQKGQCHLVMLAFFLMAWGGNVWGQEKADTVKRKPFELELDSAYATYDSPFNILKEEQAIPHYARAIKLAKKETPVPWGKIANTYFNIADILYRLGTYQEAETYFLEAVDAWGKLPPEGLTASDSANKVRYFNSLANTSSKLGEMDVAKSRIDLALQLAMGLNKSEPDLLPLSLNNAATIFNNLGNFGLADSCGRRSVEGRLALFKKARREQANGAAENLAYSLVTLAEIFREKALAKAAMASTMGDSMLRYLALTKPFFTRLGPYLQHEIEKNYAIAYHLQGDLPKAAEAFEVAVKNAMADADYGARDRGMLLEAQGRCLTTMQNYDGALAAFQQALMAFLPAFRDARPSINPPESLWTDEPWLFVLFNDKASAYAKQDRPERALECRKLAFKYVDHLREGFSTSGSKQFITTLVYPEYEAALQLAYQNTQDCDDVFEFMERSKTNEILESMRQAARFGDFAKSNDLLAKWRRLQAEISMAMAEESPDVQELIRQQKELKDTIDKRYPQLQTITQHLNIVTIKSVQSYLHSKNKETVWLEYFVGKESIYVVAIDATQARCYRTPHDRRFDQAVEAMIKAISTDPDESTADATYPQYEDAAYTVFRYLFGPMIEDKFRTEIPRSLVIVPDGRLALLPFEALLTARGGGATYLTAAYLIRDCEVRYAHSATTMLTQRIHSKSDSLKANDELLAVSASPKGSLSTLKYVEKEAEAAKEEIGGLHLHKGIWSLFRNTLPTKFNVIQQAQHYNLLHFACHAIADKENPMHSWIALDDGADHPDSLFAYEVMGMTLHAQLAVLSGCNTGDGRLQSGEGVMSLARAFFVAGCERVIMSLWNLNDQSTSEVMGHFYDHLNDGHAAPQSLRMARLDYLDSQEQPARAHPYYWAAMVAVGDDGTYVQQGTTNWSRKIIWGSIVALIIALIMRRRRRNRRKKR